MKVWAPQSAFAARRDGRWAPLLAPLAETTSPEAVEALWTAFLLNDARTLPGDWTDWYRDACDARKEAIKLEQANREMDSIVGRIAREDR